MKLHEVVKSLLPDKQDNELLSHLHVYFSCVVSCVLATGSINRA